MDKEGWFGPEPDQVFSADQSGEEGALRRKGATQHNMVFSAGAAVSAAKVERLCRQAHEAFFVVQRAFALDQLPPPALAPVYLDLSRYRKG